MDILVVGQKYFGPICGACRVAQKVGTHRLLSSSSKSLWRLEDPRPETVENGIRVKLWEMSKVLHDDRKRCGRTLQQRRDRKYGDEDSFGSGPTVRIGFQRTINRIDFGRLRT